jgi:GT2 family glycosyltransferase/glycosyltransferase involved in cell wall biosynthesis
LRQVRQLPIDIIIPFYRQPSLVKTLFDSLHRVSEELRATDCRVIAINDSPDDGELKERLRQAAAELSAVVPCRVIENAQNIGFGRSVNGAAAEPVANRHDVILLNSDTIVFPGAIAELQRVANLDPMIGFLSPRSNNATICSFPPGPEFRKLTPEQSFAVFRELSGYLPEYHYVPVAVGFCLYIKFQIMDEFGLMDEIYGRGYNEENDLIMRANRCGYQAALANHAFVYHLGEASFGISDSPKDELEKRNSALLVERYPEYPRSISRYFEGVRFQAESMLTALLPDSEGRLDLVFDFSSMGTYHNGTFAAAKCILEAALEQWKKYFHIYVMVSEEAQRFHQLDKMTGLFLVTPETTRTFAIAFRFGQPFDYDRLARMSRVGVLNVYMMLDTIAMDCLYLHQLNLETIWGTVFNYADAVLYNSKFVQDQFHRRFRRRPDLKEMAAYHSLDLADYRDPQGASAAGSYILVIGNAFAHKYVGATVDALIRAFPREKIVALGLKEDSRRNVTTYTSGNLTEDQMHSLLHGAKVVVFPSHAEGFGIPVVESLAYSKPVLARSIPVIRELREHLPVKDNLILYGSTKDLIARLHEGFPKWQSCVDSAGCAGVTSWASGTAEIGEFLRGLIGSWSFSDHLIPRLAYMRVLEDHRHELNGPLPTAAGVNGDDENGKNTRRPNVDPQVVQDLKAQLRDREIRIAELESSLSWRITAPIRALGSIYLRMFGK